MRREAQKVAVVLMLILVLILIFADCDGVFAVIESTGPEGYGWQQVYGGTSPDFKRLTASSDRQYYDYGYKEIQIYVREEDYWSQDCGWWYVSNPTLSYIKILDNGSGQVYYNNSLGPLTKGTTYITYHWGSNTSGTEKPGQWTVEVSDGTNTATFYIYVRGQLNVTSITTSSNPTVGSTVWVNATVRDHTGAIVDSLTVNKPEVTMYVTGPGFYSESLMAAGTNVWQGSFTPSAPGDYYIVIKAGDGHKYWIDGRGDKKVVVAGTFPQSFNNSFLKLLILVIFSLACSYTVKSRIRRRRYV
jgi:hypothetical protein